MTYFDRGILACLNSLGPALALALAWRIADAAHRAEFMDGFYHATTATRVLHYPQSL